VVVLSYFLVFALKKLSMFSSAEKSLSPGLRAFRVEVTFGVIIQNMIKITLNGNTNLMQQS